MTSCQYGSRSYFFGVTVTTQSDCITSNTTIIARVAQRSEHLRYRMSTMPLSMEVHTEA